MMEMGMCPMLQHSQTIPTERIARTEARGRLVACQQDSLCADHIFVRASVHQFFRKLDCSRTNDRAIMRHSE